MEKDTRKIRDAYCKRLLTRKDVIVNILKYCVLEYKDCSKEEILACLDTDTNDPKCIKAEPMEDDTMPDVKIFYDVLFYPKMPHSLVEIPLYINLEAQNEMPNDYPLICRAIYYASRLISRQKNESFKKSEYGSIRKVYSIWICTTSKKEQKDTINCYSITEKHEKGNYKEKKDYYSLINIIMLYIGDDYNYASGKEGILEMLSLLFKNLDLEPSKITNILNKSYDILLTNKEVSDMCTLSQGLINEGIEIGKLQGIETGKFVGIKEQLTHSTNSMIRLGFSKKDIIKILDIKENDMELFVSIYNDIKRNNN